MHLDLDTLPKVAPSLSDLPRLSAKTTPSFDQLKREFRYKTDLQNYARAITPSKR